MTTWVCADCGETYENEVSPCKKCAGERLARLEDDKPINNDEIRRTDVDWRCTECGSSHRKNNPPCNRCGNMTLEAVYDNSQTSNETSGNPSGTQETRSITLRTLAAYGFGILAILNFTGSIITISIIAALLHIVAIFSSFPPARRQLSRRYNVELSTPAAGTIYLVTTLVGNILILQ